MRPPRRRTSPAVSACGIALTLLTLLGGTACTQEKPAAPASATSAPALTARQAELLALTRFANYRRGTAQVTADIPVQGHPARLTGRIDWRHSTGLAILQGNGGVLEHGRHLLRWDRTTVSVQRNWPGPLPRTHPATAGPNARSPRRHPPSTPPCSCCSIWPPTDRTTPNCCSTAGHAASGTRK